jgi:hypothetical protein
MRDDFAAGTKELLARRVGFVCSNPECRQPTSGPQADPTRAVNIGVAAHISAASPGGARYGEDLWPEQRADSSNGIWLCQTCAKLIDSDPIRFSRIVIEGWKRAAERAAAVALSEGRQSGNRSQAGHAKIEHLMPSYSKEGRHVFVRQFASGSGEQLSWLSRVS